MSKTSRDKKKKAVNSAINPIINAKPARNDPNGSYTGKPINKKELPTQDADDL